MNVSFAGSGVATDECERVARYQRAYETTRAMLLARMKPDGFWEGRLSSSALSTATAVSAFAIAAPTRCRPHIERGVAWLVKHQNEDGGWGDSPESPSNLPTTVLVQAALDLAAGLGAHATPTCLERAGVYLERNAGTTANERARTIRALYGKDRTFAAPILANCALAPARDGVRIEWAEVPGLPFELALFPRPFFRWLRLNVVSYALPALIAIGQLVHIKRPSRNIIVRLIRNAGIAPTLRLIESIQPSSGGFLEAVPLTSFVVMSLAATGKSEHPVVRKGLGFLERLARSDGSWPIDANLDNWLTSLAVSALTGRGGALGTSRAWVRDWLMAQQHRAIHSYTDSQPGGWAWTHLPGGVPDADDTAAALIALSSLGGYVSDAARDGVIWLLGLQNRDGGWPTFCKGWGKLPFDRSAPDLTAHALRALWAWKSVGPLKRIERAVADGFDYLRRTQRNDGAWEPIWFGNQFVREQGNPVYGTARVLAVYRDTGKMNSHEALRGIEYLVEAQNPDGSWGGDRNVPGTMEETALTVEALAGLPDNDEALRVCLRGADYLSEKVDQGGLEHPAPIGLYFARLWYAEMLYPAIWTVGAFGRLLDVMTGSVRTLDGPPAVKNVKKNA